MKESSHTGFGSLLRTPGFPAFLLTQSLGAFNDNAYRIIVSMRAVHVAASSDASGKYLSLAIAIFVLPFLLFSGYSGYLADSISKRTVLIGVKAFEIAVMAFGVAAFFSTRIELMFVVLFLMAVHSTIFSPAKYGILPEMLPDAELSRGNALLEMTTFVAIVLGTSTGSILYTAWRSEAWKTGLVMLALSLVGFAASLRIPRVRPAGSSAAFRWNPFAEVISGARELRHNRAMWLSVVAISYFFFLATLFQADLLLFGSEVLHANDTRISVMVACLSIGVGLGNLLAGRLSGDKVELGLVPLGSLAMAFFSACLWAARGSFWLSTAAVTLLGAASGLFVVPLFAYLQQRSGEHEKGRILATNNFLNTIGMMLAAATLSGMHDRLGVDAATLILIFAFVTVMATVYIVTVVPEFLVRFVLWLVTHTLFRVRIVGQENVPVRGPALLVANHMSHVDGFLVSACVQRFIRFLVWRPFFEMKAMGWFLRVAQAIPVGGNHRRDAVESIRQARAELAAGHVVCIFAEGAISRTGNLLPFKRGLEKIAHGLDVPVIPVHLDRLWGSIFSFERGRFFWKWPKRLPYPVTVSFGRPLPSTATADAVRSRIQELGADAAIARKSPDDLLHRRFVRMARSRWSQFAMADSTGRELTYGNALTGAMLLARWVRRQCGDRQMVGVVLPASIGGALVNIGTTLAGRVPVNLNFTAGREAMAAAVAQCGIRTVITSKQFVAKAKLDVPGAVYLEDILAGAGKLDKLRAWLAARLLPVRFAAPAASPDALATVIFSSGSTGVPKGVMLSHYNIIANIEAIAQVYWVGPHDRIVGSLPFFHSFGFSITIWFPLLSGCGAVYHANPADAKAIGALVGKYRGTFLLSTPTFCANFVRKCTKEEFATLRFVLVGAEKLREAAAAAFEEKFGVRPLEGYGCTEMAPVVAVNVPDFHAGSDVQVGAKPGTVGHPLPGVAVRIVDPATLEPLPPTGEGLLLVRGANRMLGYLGQPELTAQAMPDGWYITGDIAAIDDEGFLRITDRLARFSKIAGEMVPHLRVEEAVYEVIGDSACAVAGVPDDQRGERLVVLHTRPDMPPAELWQRLTRSSLPALWVPKAGDIHFVESLPSLGTGKLDLRAVKARVRELSAE